MIELQLLHCLSAYSYKFHAIFCTTNSMKSWTDSAASSPWVTQTLPTMPEDTLQMFEGISQNICQHSPKYFSTFPRIFSYIPRYVWLHSMECLATFPRMFGDIPRKCLATFLRMFSNISWNVWGHSPECLATFPRIKHSSRSPHSVPRSCITGFIHSLDFTLVQ